jgi:3-methyladenine DNA glycosylase/8-oxoguanine DNA glycosylase
MRVRVRPAGRARAKISARRRPTSAAQEQAIVDGVRHLLRLDEDLSALYELLAEDKDLAWAIEGAGRLMRGQTVFEDVVKTICTTNCTWSATVRMVSAIVEHLGAPAAGVSPGPFGRAFPTPEAMAEAGEDFYKDVARAGYRGAYLRSLAASVADGELDLEKLAAPADELPDEELAARLLALPGVGPYATAHMMMLLGRYTPLILDSWTRPKYLKVSGAKGAKDATIERRFRRYGPYAGLAFWLYLTRDWVDD